MHELYSEFARTLTTYDDYELILGAIMIAASAFGFLVFVWGFIRQFLERGFFFSSYPSSPLLLLLLFSSM